MTFELANVSRYSIRSNDGPTPILTVCDWWAPRYNKERLMDAWRPLGVALHLKILQTNGDEWNKFI